MNILVEHYNNNYDYPSSPFNSCRSSFISPLITNQPFALSQEEIKKQPMTKLPSSVRNAPRTPVELNSKKIIEDITCYLPSKLTVSDSAKHDLASDWTDEQHAIENSLHDVQQRQQLRRSLEALLTDVFTEQEEGIKSVTTDSEEAFFEETVDKQSKPSQPNKMLSKKKRKKLNRQTRMMATAEKKAIDQQALREEQLRGFTLHALESKKPVVTCAQDQLKLAEDFRKKIFSEGEMSKRHVWKRLNFFHVMCRYVNEKALHLQEFDFPCHQKNQYQSDLYVVPSSYANLKLGYEGYERAHISLFSKIVVQKEGHLSTLDGPLIVLNQQTDLSAFFNTCDIAPKTINAIDCYVECELRDFAIQLLKEVKEGTCSPMDAADDLAKRYGWILIELQDRILEKNVKAPKNHFLAKDFENTVQMIIQDRQKSFLYINGMLEAIMHFRHHVCPNLQENLTFDRTLTLYEPLN